MLLKKEVAQAGALEVTLEEAIAFNAQLAAVYYDIAVSSLGRQEVLRRRDVMLKKLGIDLPPRKRARERYVK